MQISVFAAMKYTPIANINISVTAIMAAIANMYQLKGSVSSAYEKEERKKKRKRRERNEK